MCGGLAATRLHRKQPQPQPPPPTAHHGPTLPAPLPFTSMRGLKSSLFSVFCFCSVFFFFGKLTSFKGGFCLNMGQKTEKKEIYIYSYLQPHSSPTQLHRLFQIFNLNLPSISSRSKVVPSPPGSTKPPNPLAQPKLFPITCTKNLHPRLLQNYLHFFTCATTTVIPLFIVPNPNLNPKPQTNTGAFTSTLLPLTSTAMNAANLTLSSLGGCGGCGCC